MERLVEWLQRMPRDRLKERISAATYGTALVLASVGVISVSNISERHGAELVVGVGVATWVAHVFAEVLAEHVDDPAPRHGQMQRAMLDGSPILAATVLPALVFVVGRGDVVGVRTDKIIAIVVGVLQLLLIGDVVARIGKVRPARRWIFVATTCGVGVVVVSLIVFLGH